MALTRPLWMIGLGGLLVAALPARADFLDEAAEAITTGFDILIPEEFRVDDLDIKLGVGAGLAPDYHGADKHKFRVLPLIDANYRDIVRLTGSTLRVSFYQTNNFRAGLLANYRSGRDEDDSPDLTGLGNVGKSWELGGFVQWRHNDLLLRGRVAADVASGHEGVVVTAQAEHGIWRSADERIAVLAGVSAMWASGNYMQSFFGVTPAQAQAASLPVFNAKSGFRDISGRVVSRWRLDGHWSLLGLLRYGRLLGDAAGSPLVKQRGSANQMVTGVGLSFNF